MTLSCWYSLYRHQKLPMSQLSMYSIIIIHYFHLVWMDWLISIRNQDPVFILSPYWKNFSEEDRLGYIQVEFNATSAITSFFFVLGKYIKFYHMLSSQFNFFLDLDSVSVANSERVKKYLFLTNGWKKLYYIAEALLCVCFVEIEFTPEKMKYFNKVLWSCGIVSSPPEWLFDTARFPLLCVCTPHSGLYTLSATTIIIQINMHISLYNHIYGIWKQRKCHVCHQVQNNTNIISTAVTYTYIYISMKAVIMLLFR